MTVKDTIHASTTEIRDKGNEKIMVKKGQPFAQSAEQVPDQHHKELSESSSDMKSNSLHEYAHLAGYLQTRVIPGQTANCNGPEEE